MKSIPLLFLGAGLAFLVASTPPLVLVVGILSGLVSGLAEHRFPRARPTYLPPLERPAPLTARNQATIAALTFAGGIGLALFIWANASLGSRLIWMLMTYFAGGLLGVSMGMLLTAKRSREDHNNWLASMVAKPSLDTDQ